VCERCVTRAVWSRLGDEQRRLKALDTALKHVGRRTFLRAGASPIDGFVDEQFGLLSSSFPIGATFFRKRFHDPSAVQISLRAWVGT
jgi:hypothetical protein